MKALTAPDDEGRVMMRWWLFGPSVTNEELGRELETMAAAGLGGVELAFVYPLALGNPGDPVQNTSLLSDSFAKNLNFISRKTKELGLRLDVTGGSGWSYGGAGITNEYAAKELRLDIREIAPHLKEVPNVTPFDGDELVAAYIAQGSSQEWPWPGTLTEVAFDKDKLTIPDGDGPRVLHRYYSGRTGQMVKRPAIGAEGCVIDHFSRTALQRHLDVTTSKILDALEPGSVTCLFCDSLEAYKGSWTPALPEEFKKRRGYDLKPNLAKLWYDLGDDYLTFRADYGQTLSELYEENFLVPLHEYCAARGISLRVQNYGVPPASLSSHRHIDVISGETWGWRGFQCTKWASSAAAHFDKTVVSSETWTWAHSPSFRATPGDLRGEAHEHFLLGINQLIGHGWPYSPPEAGKPGWMFYASSALNDNNAWWPVMPDMAAYLQRTSSVLQLGKPVNDVALLLSNRAALASFKPDDKNYLDLWRRLKALMGPDIVGAILDAGVQYVGADDGTLDLALSHGAKAVVVPDLAMLEPDTLKRLHAFKNKGGYVAVVGTETGETDGFPVFTPDEITAWLRGSVGADLFIEGGESEVGFVHRKTEHEDIYFIANTGHTRRDFTVKPRQARAHFSIVDANRVAVSKADKTLGGSIKLSLEPYEALFLVAHDDTWQEDPTFSTQLSLAQQQWGTWSVKVGDRNARDVTLPYDWATRPETRFFSGAAHYSSNVTLAELKQDQTYWLDLGKPHARGHESTPGGKPRDNSYQITIDAPVSVACEVSVNGKRAGSIWASPYRLEVTNLLQKGDNLIEITVWNTSINHMAGGETLPNMEALKAKFGQRATLQDFEKIDPLPSGLMDVPQLYQKPVNA